MDTERSEQRKTTFLLFVRALVWSSRGESAKRPDPGPFTCIDFLWSHGHVVDLKGPFSAVCPSVQVFCVFSRDSFVCFEHIIIVENQAHQANIKNSRPLHLSPCRRAREKAASGKLRPAPSAIRARGHLTLSGTNQ